MPKQTLFRDAVHKDIAFDPFELDVIHAPQFQRMSGIRQLGLAHLLYPCAQHSRFEHSLGVAHTARIIVNAVRSNHDQSVISEPELRFTRALALVHDIGHLPFGHTLEDERPIFPAEHHHDETDRLNIFLRDTELGDAVGRLGKDIGRPNIVDDLIRVMKYTHQEKEDARKLGHREVLFADIVGNTICADLLDYLLRDTYFTGLQHRYDERIISAFKLDGDQIYIDLDEAGALRHSVFSEIVALLRLRYTLGERIYYHPIKNVASAMISKAVELSGLSHRALAPLRDEELLYLLENASTTGKLSGEVIQNVDQVETIVRMIRCRKFYTCAYSITGDAAAYHVEKLVSLYHDAENVAERRKVETAIAARVGALPCQVVIFCPHNKMASKAAMVRVRWPHNPELEALETISEKEYGLNGQMAHLEIDQLKRKHQSLWRMSVYVDPAVAARLFAIKEHCREIFYNISDADSDANSNSSAKAAAYKQTMEAIAVADDRDTIDIAQCVEMCENTKPLSTVGGLSDVPRILPRKTVAERATDSNRSSTRKKTAAKRVAGDDEPLLVATDIIAGIRKHLKKMPVVQREIVEGQLPSIAAAAENLGGRERALFLTRLDEAFASVAHFEQNQFSGGGFVDLIRDTLKKAADEA